MFSQIFDRRCETWCNHKDIFELCTGGGAHSQAIRFECGVLGNGVNW